MLEVDRQSLLVSRLANHQRRFVPQAVSLTVLLLAATPVVASANSADGPENPLVVTEQSDRRLPILSVYRDDEQLMVAAEFPTLPGFVADSWCYESEVDFVDARALPGGRVELQHALPDQPNVLLVTVVSPEVDAVEFVVHWEVDRKSKAIVPENVPTPNLCWQLKRAAGFRSKPDPYPEFVKRCFMFTKSGRTWLSDTTRRNIPVRSAEDERNNPPWVQMYVGAWQEVPQAGPEQWADYSPNQYATRIIGTVSRDGRHLAALANDSATVMAQAWHDCLHNNAQWLPPDKPMAERTWRVKFYVLPNDPELLRRRVARDFPAHDQAAPKLSQSRPVEGFQSPGVHENLPVFYREAVARLNYPLSWKRQQGVAYDAWQESARRQVMGCLLDAPPKAEFQPTIIGTKTYPGYDAHKLIFNLSADSRVQARLLTPHGPGPFPAVLLLHDHGAEFRIGKEKVTAPWDDPSERMALADEWVQKYYGGRFLGNALAERGYVCLAVDALNWSDRGGGGYEGQQALASNLLHMGMSLAGVIAHDDLRAAEFLASRPEVDPDRIAAMGLSMGGFRTWQVAALSPHIAAGASVCWMATVESLMTPGNNQTKGDSSFTMLHPGLFQLLDYPDVASIACPKPMLFYSGRQDKLFPVPGVEAAYQKMHGVWASQHASDRLVTKLWDVPHVFSRAMQEEAFAWLDRQLGGR